MITVALIIGIAYGVISVKGQFCMNSGFSNAIRIRDTTKLKSFILAILIQMAVVPLVFTLIYLFAPDNSVINRIQLPPLFLIATALGGFLFGIFMHYTGGCAAGVFYKIGEKNTGAIFAAVGFVGGVYAMERGFLRGFRESTQEAVLLNQQPIWKLALSSSTITLLVLGISVIAMVIIYILLKREDRKPPAALWGWKKTGFGIGILGLVAWISALYSDLTYGMSLIPGAIDMSYLTVSWGLLFVVGIPLGAYWSFTKKRETQFVMPKPPLVAKRMLGGLGLGASSSLALGCTVGHGLTFTPLLGVGSFVGILFIFLGSGLVGYLTRK